MTILPYVILLSPTLVYDAVHAWPHGTLDDEETVRIASGRKLLYVVLLQRKWPHATTFPHFEVNGENVYVRLTSQYVMSPCRLREGSNDLCSLEQQASPHP